MMTTDDLIRDGWHYLDVYSFVPTDEPLEFYRESNGDTFTARWSEFSPYFNVAGLWWRRGAVDQD